MRQKLINKYGVAVPRYTSYPTAPHFSDAVNGSVYNEWLAGLEDGEEVSLYCHIPFCDTLCWFCGCHTKVVARYQPVTHYLDLLKQEVELLANRIPGRAKISHMAWGGGSPTILKPGDVLALSDIIHSHFDISDTMEFSVEIDPRGMKREDVRALADAGVTRVSIGIQDLNPVIQKAINRIQPYDETSDVIDMLRSEGISGINLDLMYGLPHQDESALRHTIEQCLKLKPSRFALFGYAHVPWMKSHQKMIDEAVLPGAEDRLLHAEMASNLLVDAGYRIIGLDHFAHPDDVMAKAHENATLHRNFQGYTTDQAKTMLGLGASAIGYMKEGYVQNVASLHDYRRAIEAGELPIAKGINLNADDTVRKEVIQHLMCDLEVNIEDILADHNKPDCYLDDELENLADLVSDGVIMLDKRHISMTDAGRAFVRAVCARFDRYLSTGVGRHTVAV